MHYKTLVLNLIRSYPIIHYRLKAERTMLPTLDREAAELKTRHALWKDRLAGTRPDSDPAQASSEALEIALKELSDRLSAASATNGDEALSLDAAMASLRPLPTE